MGSAVFEISLAASRSAWLRDHARTAKREPRDSSFFHRNIPIRGINEKKRFLEQIPVAKFIFSCDSTTRRRWPIRARVTLAAIFGESSVRSLRARNYRAMFAERYSKNKAARSSSPRFSFRTDSESTTSEYVRLCQSCEPTTRPEARVFRGSEKRTINLRKSRETLSLPRLILRLIVIFRLIPIFRLDRNDFRGIFETVGLSIFH